MRAYRRTMRVDRGLRPVTTMGMNQPWFVKAKGVRMGMGGLEPETQLTDPFNATTWPWPQVIVLMQAMVLGYSTELVMVDSSWEEFVLIDNLEPATFWQAADFGDIVYLTNGQRTFRWNIPEDLFAEVDYTEIPQVGTLTNFKGQLVGGRVGNDWQGCDENFVTWAGIGSTRFMPDWKNEAGWRHADCGEIHLVEELADQMVIIYGESGISALIPAQQTFGYKKIAHTGLKSATSVGFGDGEHLAILADNHLWKLTTEGLELLGYKEFMVQLNEPIRISYNPIQKEYYIGDADKCFCFTNGQLTEMLQRPTSVGMLGASVVAPVVNSPSAVIDLVWGWQDLNLVSLKTVEFLEFGLATNGYAQCRAEVYYDLGTVMHATPYIPLNDSGFAYIGAGGNMFSPMLNVADFTAFQLNYITYAVKLSDNRIQNQLQSMRDGSWHVD